MRATGLHPFTDADQECPYCRVRLGVKGWHVPGMRNLADLLCTTCGREFYGDLAAGQALYTPMLLEKATGVVHDPHGVEWFAAWLRDSYARRADEPVPFDVQERRAITRPVVLLNCLDTLYGHSLLKLLNAQHYLDRADVDLVVIVPSFLKWMTPDGVAQVWSVGLPLRRGTEWNDWLAREIRRRVEAFDRLSLSHALSHPRPDEFDIERFTRVKPFPLDEWDARLVRPSVTFIWRDDRPWRSTTDASQPTRRERLKQLIASRPRPSMEQSRLVSELAEALRRDMPALDFAVAGPAENEGRGGLPEWISDLRRDALDEAAERAWCERYAASHVVVGVHGSNMLLPSAHAGGVVELIGPERWGNFTQDILFRDAADCRETLFRYRFVDELTPPTTLARLITMLIQKRASFRHLMNVS
jgi:DNA-directed RNA polymerase subunit RPC12/RpoP